MRPRILIVCSANQCRSPMAAAFCVHHLGKIGVDAFVMSAGVHGDGVSPATPNAMRVMREYGLDISQHRSRALEARFITGSDLVIGMTREHVREVVVLDRPCSPGRSRSRSWCAVLAPHVLRPNHWCRGSRRSARDAR